MPSPPKKKKKKVKKEGRNDFLEGTEIVLLLHNDFLSLPNH